MKTLLTGDCLSVMPTLMANSVDSIVSDPPYGLSFMGKDWDHGVPGEHFWREALRVAKPGAHLLAFGGTRTFHRLAVAMEDAGWEIRDTIMWVYGSGFPKSLDVSKAIDKAAGAERKVVGIGLHAAHRQSQPFGQGATQDEDVDTRTITAPATDSAREWSGWGTALKPAWEPIIVARKPLEGTVAENVQKWGTGAINVDGCRVEGTVTTNPLVRNVGGFGSDGLANQADPPKSVISQGRWPANLIHDGSQMVMELFPDSNGSGGQRTLKRSAKPEQKGWGMNKNEPDEVELPDAGKGSAARFFYCAKASKRDRNEGCDGLSERTTSRMNTCNGSEDDGEAWHPIDERTGKERDRFTAKTRNPHPTVKPTALMRYLCRLVTPPGGTILDPFMGSGSTGKAAVLEGFSFVGIEMQPEYVEIARCRINAATDRTPEPAPAMTQEGLSL